MKDWVLHAGRARKMPLNAGWENLPQWEMRGLPGEILADEKLSLREI